jgi:hypothetical protein
VIGNLTEMAVNATALGLVYEQLSWPQDAEAYAELRAEATRLFGELEIEELELPATHDEYLAALSATTAHITAHLSRERGRILGDTVALPFFYIQAFSLRAALNLGLHLADTGELGLVEDCLEDLGLDRDLAAVLEREAGWIILIEGESEETTEVRRAEVIKAGGSFVVRVIEEFGRREEGVEGLLEGFQALSASFEEFREEQREASRRIEALVEQGNEEMKLLLTQVQAALVQGGLSQEEAEALTEGDPQKLWDRVVRWFGGSGPRDAAEAVLWVALDFVPGGTGVKLGIRIAEAVRKSIKSGAK